MKVAISTESTCDLSNELINENDVKIIPYTITLGDDVVTDGDGVADKIFEYVKKTKILPKTSAINEEDYAEHFTKILNEGYDAIVHITLSSGISCTNSNAVSASKRFENVYIIDSKSLSTGIGLLVLYAVGLAKNGTEPSAIAEKLEKRVPNLQTSFVIDRLDYLYKGGRCNALELFGANLLKLHPQIVLHDGKMKPEKKYRGKMEKVVTEYCNDTLKEFNNYDKSIAFVTHTTATPEMVEIAKSKLKEAGFENIYETIAGGTITSHCGENTLGILYFNDGGMSK